MASSISCESLESKLREKLPGVTYVKAEDRSNGCGAKFEIEIVSECFRGLSLLAQHKLVHKALEAERSQIHALVLKTKVCV